MKENFLKRKTKQKANEIVEYPSKLIRILCVCVSAQNLTILESKQKIIIITVKPTFFPQKKRKHSKTNAADSDIHQLFFFPIFMIYKLQ